MSHFIIANHIILHSVCRILSSILLPEKTGIYNGSLDQLKLIASKLKGRSKVEKNRLLNQKRVC